MPVYLNSKWSGPERRSGMNWPRVLRAGEARPGPHIHIGLVNNMGDAALAATAHQFLMLLEEASPELEVRLTLYVLPGLERMPAGQRHVNTFYRSVEELWSGEGVPDALIVTGREPLTADLRDEDYWQCFTRVLDWAREHTLGAVWSCLAAHAAILHMDGIRRIRSAEKHFGVFEVERVGEHALTAGLPARFHVPHSRWNGIAEERLVDCGYTLLSRAADGGVDAFVQEGKSLFLFFQGHPEYESDTLLREYRRDVARYLKGESESYPGLPRDYFDAATAKALTALAARAAADRNETLLGEVAAVLKKTRIRNSWHSASAGIFRNWLGELDKVKRLRPAEA